MKYHVEYTTYQEHKVSSRYNELKVSMYFADHRTFPRLKGKAAELKHLGPALLSALVAFMDATSTQHQHTKLILQMAVKMDQILDEHHDRFKLPDAAAADFQKAAFGFVQLTTVLGHHYHDRHIMLFNFTIKSHYILHLALISRWMNPRRAWCYGGDGMMQVVNKIVQGSLAGSNPAAVIAKVVKKYAQGLGLDLSR